MVDVGIEQRTNKGGQVYHTMKRAHFILTIQGKSDMDGCIHGCKEH